MNCRGASVATLAARRASTVRITERQNSANVGRWVRSLAIEAAKIALKAFTKTLMTVYTAGIRACPQCYR